MIGISQTSSELHIFVFTGFLVIRLAKVSTTVLSLVNPYIP